MPVFSKEKAIELIKEKLIKSNCNPENTDGIIQGILDAEYSGIKSHGFHYLPIYCNHLKIGKINGQAKPSVPPSHRFANQPGEQWTMFFCDPFGNPIEIKGFKRLETVFQAA